MVKEDLGAGLGVEAVGLAVLFVEVGGFQVQVGVGAGLEAVGARGYGEIRAGEFGMPAQVQALGAGLAAAVEAFQGNGGPG